MSLDVAANDELPGRTRGGSLPTAIAARLRTAAPLAFLDGVTVYLGYLVALVLRFEGRIPSEQWWRFHRVIGPIVALNLATNLAFGLYGRIWRYASIEEARRILVASSVVGAAVIGGTVATRPIPVSVAVLGFTLSVAGFGALRFQSRLFGLRRREATAGSRVLVVGAGDQAARIVRDMLAHPPSGLVPVGFVTDDARDHGRTIHGVPVVGRREDLPRILENIRPDQVLLAVPDGAPEVYRAALDACERHEIPMRVLPRLDEVVGGTPTVRDIRDIRIEDLIGRQLIETDLGAVETLLRGKRVLVTGAGGSIGSEIARQVAAFGPAALILLEHDETHLHDLITDLRIDGGEVVTLLADVRDYERILTLMTRERPDVVFHAAAHKHVPLLEEHPGEAIKTNILGTAHVAEAALRAGTQRFLLISTDKAIQAVSVMGVTKQIAEQVARSLDGRGCRFSAVRFGNVLGSRGSVVPTFVRQIRRGGPVTVTDPVMTRYFMSISEAVQLVLQAAAMSEGGEVFTLDMGEPVNILSLARRMIRLAGRVPDRDIAIEITGVRAGERLHELIRAPLEAGGPSAHPKIFRSVPPSPNPAWLRAAILALSKRADTATPEELRDGLRALAEAGGPAPLTVDLRDPESAEDASRIVRIPSVARNP